MIKSELRQHQWKAFRRNPMFERNMGVKIFMFFMFGILAMEFLMFGFVLDKLLLEIGEYERAIDTFNSIILYILALDFIIKFFFKSNQSMQIAPYLSLPVKRNTLFNFLLQKEFSSFWNFYFMFLVVPFAFKAILPFEGLISVVLYIIFFYLLCVMNSLIVSYANNLTKRSAWFYIPIAVLVLIPFVFPVTENLNLGQYTQQIGDLLLNNNLLVWIGLIFMIAVFWVINRVQMRNGIYRELQGEKVEKISSFSRLSFLDQFGDIGEFIQLEIKMILRSPRLKQQTLFAGCLLFAIYLYFLYSPYIVQSTSTDFVLLLYGMITVGLFGITMGQLLFTSESSFFDGMMVRNLSIRNMLRSKYLLYSSFALVFTILLLIPVFHGKLNLMLLIANFFYVTGPVFFMIFQNAVYNKTYYDLFDKGMMNWKGQSGSMVALTMITMFLPVIIVLIIIGIFGKETAYWFMIIIGILFTFTSQQWLQWTYNRFLERRYRNMEGFRSNT